MRQENEFNWIIPIVIGFFAIIVGSVRWFMAAMAIDGFIMPAVWNETLHPISGFSGVGMAVIDAFATAYVMYSVGLVKGRVRWALLAMVILMALSVTGFLVPFYYARSGNVEVAQTLNSTARLLWVVAAISAPVITVATVGLAQASLASASIEAGWLKTNEELHGQLEELQRQNTDVRTDFNRLQEQLSQATQVFKCEWCPRTFPTKQHLGGHMAKCPNRPSVKVDDS